MKTKEIAVFKLEPKDWNKYREIRLEALKEEPRAFNSDFEEAKTFPSSHWEEALKDTNSIFVFAKYDDKVIGLMHLTLNELDEPSYVVVVHSAYVNKDYRGLGAGRMLLEYLINEIKDNPKIKTLKLWVKESQIPAIKLYESFGFVHTKRVGEHTLIMEKRMIGTS